MYDTIIIGAGMSGLAAGIRLAYYDYRFTTSAERAETGAWWHRELIDYLTEPVSLADARSDGS